MGASNKVSRESDLARALARQEEFTSSEVYLRLPDWQKKVLDGIKKRDDPNQDPAIYNWIPRTEEEIEIFFEKYTKAIEDVTAWKVLNKMIDKPTAMKVTPRYGFKIIDPRTNKVPYSAK